MKTVWQVCTDMERKLIQGLFALMLMHSAFYWLGKFQIFFVLWYETFRGHWGLFMLLQFLGVASLVIDLIVAYDRFRFRLKNVYGAVVVLLAISFAAQLLFGVMELYMRGSV